MLKFNHAYDIAFEVMSADKDAKDVTPEMLKQALLQRIQQLDEANEWHEAVGAPFDTYDVEKG